MSDTTQQSTNRSTNGLNNGSNNGTNNGTNYGSKPMLNKNGKPEVGYFDHEGNCVAVYDPAQDLASCVSLLRQHLVHYSTTGTINSNKDSSQQGGH
nr:uncharacterized protein CI109_001672 [Kwoniella shandongensis]KAA5529733.1 hypothetical protein CI109_001672 [Kwoniella shandongensis]